MLKSQTQGLQDKFAGPPEPKDDIPTPASGGHPPLDLFQALLDARLPSGCKGPAGNWASAELIHLQVVVWPAQCNGIATRVVFFPHRT